MSGILTKLTTSKNQGSIVKRYDRASRQVLVHPVGEQLVEEIRKLAKSLSYAIGPKLHPNFYGATNAGLHAALVDIWTARAMGLYLLKFDLAAAFNSVDRQRLLKLLRKHGAESLIPDLTRLGCIHPLADSPSFSGISKGFATSPHLFGLYVSPLLTRLNRRYKTLSYFDDFFLFAKTAAEANEAKSYVEFCLRKHSSARFRLTLSQKARKRPRIIPPSESFSALGVVIDKDRIHPNKKGGYFTLVAAAAAKRSKKASCGNFTQNQKIFIANLFPTTTWSDPDLVPWAHYCRCQMGMKYRPDTFNPGCGPQALIENHNGISIPNTLKVRFYDKCTELVPNQESYKYIPWKQYTSLYTHSENMSFQVRTARLIAQFHDVLEGSVSGFHFPSWMGASPDGLTVLSTFTKTQQAERASTLVTCLSEQSQTNLLKLFKRFQEADKLEIRKARMEAFLAELWRIFIFFYPADTLTYIYRDRFKVEFDTEWEFIQCLIFNEFRIINRFAFPPECRPIFPQGSAQQWLRAFASRKILKLRYPSEKWYWSPEIMKALGRIVWPICGRSRNSQKLSSLRTVIMAYRTGKLDLSKFKELMDQIATAGTKEEFRKILSRIG